LSNSNNHIFLENIICFQYKYAYFLPNYHSPQLQQFLSIFRSKPRKNGKNGRKKKEQGKKERET
jgi:hypothetical protein